jgi:hypothetical protein
LLWEPAGKSGGKTEKLSRYYGKQFGFAPPKKGQVSAPSVSTAQPAEPELTCQPPLFLRVCCT